MTTVLFWFRNDVRLTDNAALLEAINGATRAGAHLLPLFCHDDSADAITAWDFVRVGNHRRHFLRATLDDLTQQLRALGSDLIELTGRAQEVIPILAEALGATQLITEAIAAPEEEDAIAALRSAGLTVDTVWQSSLLDPADLPCAVNRLPDMFTAFRHAVEKAEVLPPVPVPAIRQMPPLPALPSTIANRIQSALPIAIEPDARSSFPYWLPAFVGGETAGLNHLERYFDTQLAHSYKQTRNGLSGTDYSTKFSPWLASGALSARTIYVRLKQFEHEHGASDSSYWIWFELLWRDYFRFLHLKYGRQLYRARGLAQVGIAPPRHHAAMFKRWCHGATGEPLVDAGMRELFATGYLSNRLRQVVASYLIHDLGGDWRAGAAWFEAQLIDYDVTSNQGNWLYLAGRGTDPRGGRRFDPKKQARDYDVDRRFQGMWST